ncbi:MAG TPA: cytochrome c3 family protein [Bacteroidota bacterium]|nr:cytochrome c3 family protein [Bacteroidota bacterium]
MALVRTAALLGAALLVIAPGAIAADACLTCHQGLGDRPSALWAHDVHARHGVTCAGCHGGDPASEDMEKAMSRDAGFTGKPAGDAISLMCARCHADSSRMASFGAHIRTDQFALLQQSVHGRLALDGKERIVQCTTCHGSHGILPVADPAAPVSPLHVAATCASCHSNAKYIRAYNPALPVDQLEKYRTSVHGARNAAGDARVAECASCHGNHGILSARDVRSSVYPTNIPATCAACHANASLMASYGIPADQYDKYTKSVHGLALLVKKDLGAPACNSCHGNHGAAPPGVESISQVCGTCHALNADLFAKSPHKSAFDAGGLPECETCHGKHDIAPASTAMLGVGEGALCTRCHSEGDPGYLAAAAMKRLSDSLAASDSAAGALVEDAEQKGMEIAEAKFHLRDARQAVLEARTTVHAFDEPRFAAVIGKGLAVTTAVADEGTKAVAEYYFRRIGLGVATLIITLLAVSLYLYIRRLERRQAAGGGREPGFPTMKEDTHT